MSSKLKKTMKWTVGILLTPIALFLLLSILIYLPPVQKYAVDKACEWVKQDMNWKVSVGEVRLAFPFDLVLGDMLAIDEENDTILDAEALRLNVPVMPLFEGRADIDGFILKGAYVNTKSIIGDCRIQGRVGKLVAHSRGVKWERENVMLNDLLLSDADVLVCLSDTAAPDTTPSTAKWVIDVEKAEVRKTKVDLRFVNPQNKPDFSYFGTQATLGELVLKKGHFDTGKNFYGVEKLHLKDGAVNLDLAEGDRRSDAFDVNHMRLTSLNFGVDSLSYNEKGQLRCGVKNLQFAERCGFSLDNLTAGVYFDDERAELNGFDLSTAHSKITAGVSVNWRALSQGLDSNLVLSIESKLGRPDVMTVARMFLDAETRSLLQQFWPAAPVTLNAKLSGSPASLNIRQAYLQLPGLATVSLAGNVRNVLNSYRAGNLKYKLETSQNLLKVVQKYVGNSIKIPTCMSLAGDLAFQGDFYKTNANFNVPGGSAVIGAQTNLASERYDVKLKTKGFQIRNFIPDLPVTPMTAEIHAAGTGYNPMAAGSALHAEANFAKFAYDVYPLDNTQLRADVNQGLVKADVKMGNAMAHLVAHANADIRNMNDLAVALQTNIDEFNLHKIGMSGTPLSVGGQLDLDFRARDGFKRLASKGTGTNLRMASDTEGTNLRDLAYDVTVAPDTTTALLNSGDLDLALGLKGGIDQLTSTLSKFTAELDAQIKKKNIDQERLKRLLPTMSLDLTAGRENPLAAILELNGISYSGLAVDLNANPTTGLNGAVTAGLVKNEKLQIDTAYLVVNQDTSGVRIKGEVKNYLKTNPNKFEAELDAYALAMGVGVHALFRDANGDTGVSLGVKAEIEDEGYRVSLYPTHPILAYRNFTINDDNFITVTNDFKRFAANVDLLADDGTGLKIYGEPRSDGANDITLSISELNLGELSRSLPFLPAMKGMLTGDVHVSDENDKISAMASLEANDFKYEGTDLGKVGVDAMYMPKEDGEQYVDAFLMCNDTEVLQASGSYFDRGKGELDARVKLIELPLPMLNPFLAGTDFALNGSTVGEMRVHGPMDKLLLDGQLVFDSAHIYSNVYGVNFKMDEQPIVVEGSKLTFKDYALRSTGPNPLLLNGSLDASNLDKISLNFRMNANDFQLIDANKTSDSELYGKLFSNFRGSLTGTLNDMRIRGNLDVLEKTNVTYILKDSPLTVDDQLSSLVTFKNFQDTTEVETPLEAQSTIDISLNIGISDAARFHCFLSEDGRSYVDLIGGGNLALRLTQQGDMRLTGRFTVEQGEMKYELPVIPLKTFKLKQGSYVDFTGDVLNPTLNLSASERVRASYTENEATRPVNFDVGVKITRTLADMGLEFTMEAPEDLSAMSDINNMTAAQRSKAAVALLATGMYINDSNPGAMGGLKASNALNAFLNNEIQNITGAALKTIDLNFGIEDGLSDAGTTTKDYTFQFAKRFLDDRISLIIGGKVSTGADARNSAASFIDNVSVEYRLDQGATRYIRAFYDRSSQDPLEGRLTKTGAGLVLRRKTNKLSELFMFKKSKK